MNVLKRCLQLGGVNHEKLTKVAYCSFDLNDFCSGSVFVPNRECQRRQPLDYLLGTQRRDRRVQSKFGVQNNGNCNEISMK